MGSSLSKSPEWERFRSFENVTSTSSVGVGILIVNFFVSKWLSV